MKEHLNTSSQIWIEVFNSTKDGPTFSSTVDKVTSAANELLAHEVWSKCPTEYRAEHEHYKDNPGILPINLYAAS